MSNLIKVDISRDKLIAIIKFLGMDQPDREELLKALSDNNVVYGIMEDALDRCASGIPGEVTVIAKGDPPIPGKDGWVEILFEKIENEEDASVDEANVIDYRETSKLISVNEGTLLAQKHHPQVGEPGKTVTNEVVLPPKPREARIMTGRGVKLDSDAIKAYSTIQGRPVIKKSGSSILISVEPSYTISGDVCMKTGNIRFKGDIVVSGNISETMTLEASGNVTVGGIITGANVFCGANLIVKKNVISSNITAGMGSIECMKINYIIKDLYTDLNNMVQLMDQLKNKLSNIEKAPFAQVVNSLIDGRFKTIRPNAKQLASTATFNLPFEVSDAVESVKAFAAMNFTVDDFKKMMYNLSQAINFMSSQESKNAKVSIKSAFASAIKCSGEIIVSGKGCVNTTIYAGGNVKITGPFKGGEIYSEGNVQIDELGSNLGAPPLIRVKSKNIINIKKTLPGSVIQVGSARINISRQLSSAIYRLSSDGQKVEIV